MSSSVFSTKLCNYLISKQQKDLFVIFDNFSDKVSVPENNIFFRQNEVLDKILTNIEECKRNVITANALYKGITATEKKIIKSLELDKKLHNDTLHCSLLGIEYFDQDKFMEVLDNQLDIILSKYNLHADDDYNKLHKFLSSMKLLFQSSDDILNSVVNQYIFFKEHSSENCEDEYITIYGEKYYKFDILSTLIDNYQKNISENIINKNRKKRGSR